MLIPSSLRVRLTYINMCFSSRVGSGEGTLVAVVYSYFVSGILYFSRLYLPSVYYVSNGIASPVSFFLFCLLLNFL